MSSPQITPDQAKFILGLALPTLKSEHQTTKRVIEAIPLDKGGYRPDAISKTALELAWHIVAAEKRFLGGIPAGVLDFNPIHRPESVANSAGIVVGHTPTFKGATKTLELTLKPGTYDFYCSVPGHRMAGMRGTLTVR